jgi:hypothetical protein
MSLERLFGESSYDFDAFTERRKKLSTNERESIAFFAGNRVIELGREGLKAVSEQLDPQQGIATPEDIQYAMRRYGREPAAIVAHGASILALENTLVERHFNFELYLTDINRGFQRTLYPSFVRSDSVPPIQALDVENNQWEYMIELQKGDKYFTGFFETKNEGFMPAGMRNFLKENGFMNVIRRALFAEPVNQEL